MLSARIYDSIHSNRGITFVKIQEQPIWIAWVAKD